MKTRTSRIACTAALLLSTASWTHADELSRAGDIGFHPATRHAARPTADAATTMYGHPASPLNGVAPHANADHPAVVAARRGAGARPFDASTLMIGHPASPRNGQSNERVLVSASSR